MVVAGCGVEGGEAVSSELIACLKCRMGIELGVGENHRVTIKRSRGETQTYIAGEWRWEEVG